MLASAFGMTVAPMVVFVGGIVGVALAPTPGLATLPVAALVIGTASAVLPVSRLMQRFGRKRVFLANALVGAVGACMSTWAISTAQFFAFCLGVGILGASLATIQQFRFAAMESVPAQQAPNAAALVLLGGLIAAFLGPELAHGAKDYLDGEFAGSFLTLAVCCLLGGLVLLFYQEHTPGLAPETAAPSRPWGEILAQPVLWVAVLSGAVGYAVMSYIMTATPVSMHAMMGHSLEDTKWVIQSHICAMFLPSFFSGWLINRFGLIKMMLAGIVVYLVTGAVALSGQGLMHYWLGLVLLGVGWNFLFVSGTALLPQSYLASERYRVQGLNDFVVFGVQAVASLSSGYVIFQLGWNALVLLAAPMLLIQLLALLNWRFRKSASAT